MQYGGRWSQLNKLSAVKVNQATKPGLYGDGGGLWLQVSKKGTKSWIFRYSVDGKTRDMGLGPVHTISLNRAREKAREAREMLLDGKDPIQARNAIRESVRLKKAAAKTFREIAELYIETHKVAWKNEKHISQWSNTLKTYVYPVFGNISIAEINTALIKDVLDPIWTSKNETASRIRGRIEKVIDWANASGYRKGDNPARWRGHLENLLPKRSKVQKVTHHKALPFNSVSEFMTELRMQEGAAAKALEFTILTAARTGEVIHATWDEVDLKQLIWTIPAARMKAEKEHQVPLSARTVAILNEMEAVRQNDYIFPGVRSNKPLSQMAMLMTLRRMGHDNITVHGFRSTFKDWASECTSYPNEVSEMALAHTIGNKVEAAYRRGELLNKRKDLMRDWAKYCDTITNGKNITSIGNIS